MNATTILDNAILNYERDNGRKATKAHVPPSFRVRLKGELKSYLSKEMTLEEKSKLRSSIEYRGVAVACDVSLTGTKIWLE